MTRAKLAVGTFLALAIACGADNASLFDSGKEGKTENTPAGGDTSNGGGFIPAPSAVGSPAATGVVLAHSATFPAYRLCFQNYPDMLPQPDAKVMPGANVVGVETGGAVRIDALERAPGQVYVFDERQIRDQSGEADAQTCGQLISEIVDAGPDDERPFKLDRDYFRASVINEPLGVGAVEVLTIGGCGEEDIVAQLDGVRTPVPEPLVAHCGINWDFRKGNLTAQVIRLSASGAGPTDAELPVSLYMLAPAADALNAPVTVRFGAETDAAANLTIPLGIETRLPVDQTKAASYGTLGFDVTARVDGVPVTTRQTLAEVQQLSAPADLPTTYYRAASNYALLVLGDPSHRAQGDGGVANPRFNERRALHIVAVPVLDPTKLPDGGTDGGATPDSGIR